MRWVVVMAISVGTLWGQGALPPATPPPPDEADRYSRMAKRLTDWPDLVRYRDDVSSLGEPKPGEQRVVFL